MPKQSIRPNRWSPPKAPARAKQQRSAATVTMSVFDLPGTGPEDIVVDARGQVYTGVADGRILRISPDGAEVETIANTGGRPLGLRLNDDSLLVCDSHRGLLRLHLATGIIDTLVDTIDGEPMMFCSNCAVATDGTIYFTESSRRVHVEEYIADVLEHSNTGRLSRLMTDGSVEVILDDLKFANGVVLSPDESWVAVAETTGYRISRIWLTGERAGQREDLVANLPGFPDNMSRGSDGLLWVALATPRDPLLDWLLPRPPILRRIVWALPDALRPKPQKMVWVQAYDDSGRLVHDLQTPHDRFFMATGMQEVDGTVWVGCLPAPTIARIELSSVRTPRPPG
ncbi:MAG TPA: SMP-30/gluconolactonase/LRE family protein [Jatrophihabitantaceae bacterium]|nr:SMP-30/gluconolactonase/LRE family protein [Jatrophihabitantaceae bacterium]